MKITYNNPSNKRRFFSLLPFLLLLFGAMSCQKGTDGPAGQTGPGGPAGAAGPIGATGPAGTANVMYSDWFMPPSYTKDTVYGIYGFYYNKAASGITQSIIDSGTVITFGNLNGYGGIWPINQVSVLPIIVNYKLSTTFTTDTWSALTTPGNLKIQMVNDKNSYNNNISAGPLFRYIIIPGGVHTSASSPTRKDDGVETNNAGEKTRLIDYSQMDYQQICALFKIPE
jgi:hypothetical protein